MLRTERDYQEALKRLAQDKLVIDCQREELGKTGLSEEDLEFSMQPLISFHQQLEEEVKWYEDAREGRFSPIYDLQDIGTLLIGMRIFSGLSQKQLAERTEVTEAQVSRDERNEYHSITVERAQRIFRALCAEIEIKVSPTRGECALACAS